MRLSGCFCYCCPKKRRNTLNKRLLLFSNGCIHASSVRLNAKVTLQCIPWGHSITVPQQQQMQLTGQTVGVHNIGARLSSQQGREEVIYLVLLSASLCGLISRGLWLLMNHIWLMSVSLKRFQLL